MPVINLTQELVDQGLKVPEGMRKIEWCDGVVRSLRLEQRAGSDVKSYYIRYRDDGGVTRHVKLGRASALSLQSARAQARRLLASIALGRDPRREQNERRAALTFTEFFEQHYWPHAQLRKRSAARDEQLYRLRVKPRFGNLRLGDIRTAQVQAFHDDLRSEGLAPATCDLHLAFLKHAFALAQRWDLLATPNPASAVRLFHVDNKLERYLDAEQLERLVTTLRNAAEKGSTVALIGMFLLSSGARLNEALSATWDQVDLAKRVWKIPAVNSKSKRVRSVPLNDSALAVLQQVGTQGKSPVVFLNAATGKRYVSIRKVWLRLCARAGLPGLRLHDLRHQYASLVVGGGRSLIELQALLGHSSPTISMRYAHLSPGALREAADKASVIVRPATPTPPSVQQPVLPQPTVAANSPSAGDGAEAPQRQPEADPRAA